MAVPIRGEVTQLLVAWRHGDQQALKKLVPLVYAEMRRLAHRSLQSQPLEHTLQTTALIHEAYIRLADAALLDLQDRVHFFAICAQLFRRILVDKARARGARKRGGGTFHVPFDENWQAGAGTPVDVVLVNDALDALTRIDPRKAKAVELRFFGGFSVEETAEFLNVSRETVLRDWRLARAWLKSELSRVAHG